MKIPTGIIILGENNESLFFNNFISTLLPIQSSTQRYFSASPHDDSSMLQLNDERSRVSELLQTMQSDKGSVVDCIPLLNAGNKLIFSLKNGLHDMQFQVNKVEILYNNLRCQALVFNDLSFFFELSRIKEKQQQIQLSSIVHDIRTPIQGVMGLFEILERPGASSEELSALRIGISTCKLLVFLTHDITDLGQIEVNKLEINKAPFQIENTINECVQLLSSNFAKKGISLNVVFSCPIKTIYSDKHRYMQILINLLGNALKFTEHGSVQVIASFNSETDTLITEVSDTGVGIAEKDLPKLFKLFGKIDSTSSLNPNGVGLGLTICKRLAEFMGGFITVKSQINVGSTFSFGILANSTLAKQKPVNLNPLRHPPEISDRIFVKPKCDCPKILIVEDNTFNMMIMKEYLNLLGCKGDYAYHGREAVEKITLRARQKCCKNYDLVLMDINMPVMNGMEATKEINKQITIIDVFPKTPIIALTGTELSESERQLFLEEIGFVDYQLKPISKKKLKKILQNYGLIS